MNTLIKDFKAGIKGGTMAMSCWRCLRFNSGAITLYVNPSTVPGRPPSIDINPKNCICYPYLFLSYISPLLTTPRHIFLWVFYTGMSKTVLNSILNTPKSIALQCQMSLLFSKLLLLETSEPYFSTLYGIYLVSNHNSHPKA